MSGAQGINLDTSILLNYINSSLPGDIEQDRDTQELIDSGAFYTVIGGKVRSEFDALCERRHTLYGDVVSYLMEGDDNNIFEYDPRGRDISVSENDRSHFREDIQMSWYDLEKPKQLSILRRCIQDLELYQMDLEESLVDECYDQQENPALLNLFQEELAIGHDCEVLIDAVEISREHSIETLVSIDSDITDPRTAEVVADATDRILDSEDLLEITEPQNLVADD